MQLITDPRNGVLGFDGSPLRILNNGGEISLEAYSAYIRGVNGLLGDKAVMNVGNIKATSSADLQSEGDIQLTGDLTAGSSATLETLSGSSIFVSGNINAQNTRIQVDPDATGKGKNGDILVEGNVNAGNLATLRNNTAQGNIYITGSINSGGMDIAGKNGTILAEGKLETTRQNISLASETGDIIIEGDLDAKQDLTVKTGGDIIGAVKEKGSIIYSGTVVAGGAVMATTPDGMIGYEGSVEAGNRISAEAGNGWILYNGNVRAGGNVTALMRNGSIIYANSVNAGGNVEAKITQNGNVIYLGTVKAGRNVIADVAVGDIIYGKDVFAGRSVISRTGSGTIAYMGKVTVGKDLPEQLRKGYGKIAYFDRYGLIGYDKAGVLVPVRNAKSSEIRVTGVQH